MSVSITVDGVAYDVPSNASDTGWAAAQVAFEQALATAVNEALAAPTWTAIVNANLSNSWTVDAVARRSLSPSGFVTLQLSIIGGTTGSICYTLPTGWRPPTAFSVACVTSTNFQLCSASIATNGQVTVNDGPTSDIGVDGIDVFVTFPTS